MNKYVRELFLECDDETARSLRNNKVTIVIRQTLQSGATEESIDFWVCTNAGWTRDSVICGICVGTDAASDALVIPMSPQNGFNVYGYLVVNFPIGDEKVAVIESNVELSVSVFQQRCSPGISSWLEMGWLYCSNSVEKYGCGTMNYPFSTIAEAMNYGKRISLRKGDTFYERLNLDGYTIGAYGDGNPPLVSGLSRIKEGQRPWRQVVRTIKGNDGTIRTENIPNVYKIDLTELSVFDGYKRIVNTSDNNIGTLINLDTMMPCYCRKVKEFSEMSQDYDLYQPFSSTDKSVFNVLYLYLSVNPNDCNLGLTTGRNAIEMANSMLNGISVKYWGKHGISVGGDSLVADCMIDVIGGSQIAADDVKGTGAPYGNGVEVWLNSTNTVENVEVRNCVISHCFDAGLTFQGNYTDDTIAPNGRNILFDGCTVRNCGYGFEVWDMYVGSNNSRRRFMCVDCRVTGSTFIDSGIKTGFRYPTNFPPRDPDTNCGICNANYTKIGCVVHNCRFINGNFMLTRANGIPCISNEAVVMGRNEENIIQTITVRNNLVIIKYDQIILSALPEKITSEAQFEKLKPDGDLNDQIGLYRNAAGDYTSTIIVIGKDGVQRVFAPSS
ncbi:MAG: hypothetical protein NC336_09965 [Clostridium sp.]|nr:hypothetical protein [Clostridium sp.]